MSGPILREADFRAVSIASGQTDSGIVEARNFSMFGLVMPAAFTGASISFLVANSETDTFLPLYDTTNALVSLTVAASRAYELPTSLAMWRFFKIKSAGAEGADRVLTVVRKS